MATADALNIYVPFAEWITFLENVPTLTSPAANQFARSIGLQRMAARHIVDPMACLENFGISKTQIERIIIPSLAVPLFRKVAYLETAIHAECSRWGAYADALEAEVEASLFLQHISGVAISDAVTRLFSSGPVPPFLNESQIASVRKLERDTIEALGKEQGKIAAFLGHWQLASMSVYTVTEWLKKFALLTGETIPVVCQPALIDRWALALDIGPNADMEAQADTVYA